MRSRPPAVAVAVVETRAVPTLGVTVVIPTRNRLEYLKEALASVGRQGGAVTEVIVVDDSSSDGTADWLTGEGADAWPARAADLRWRVLRQPSAQERSAARNAGLAMCETPFVLFLDDDDVLRPGVVGAWATALADRPRAAGCVGRYRRFGSLPEAARDLHPRWPVTVPLWREELLGWNVPPSALLWRTDVVRDVGGWNESLAYCEDRELNLRAYPRPFAFVPGLVVEYRVHPGQTPGSDQAELVRSVQARFVRSLPPRDRSVGEAVLEASDHLDRGLALYVAGDFRAAWPHLVSTVRRAPVLCRSPVVAPWLVGLVGKATVGAAVPRRAAMSVQRALRRRRPPAPASPEKNPMA